ncbi:MAG: hypoxanthine phosphoribosyltransferase [Phycisphaeraceae bacterium]|nr:hypoxanthine phosphoribosyltransferase [Phycisphaeraceae bacterium]
MRRDIDHVLFSREAIARRIEALGAEISHDLFALGDDAEIVLVPVMTGAVVFTADLIRAMPNRLRLHVVTASSYPGRSLRAAHEPILGNLPQSFGGRHALIVDDILDSGRTLTALRAAIAGAGAASVRSCVLLRKPPAPGAAPVPCEYVGFEIPDAFVVGYGLDFDGYYRNLPEVAVLRAGITTPGARP